MKDTDILMTISVPTSIPVQRVKDLLCNAIEGGSNYWCQSMDRRGGIPIAVAPFRNDVPFVEGGWLEVIEMADVGEENKIRLDLESIKKGLQIFAEKYPNHFADFLNFNDDATTGDVFLQCCCFGEAIYG